MSADSLAASLIELASAQRLEKIAGEDDPLALPSGQILFDEMIDPAVHCLSDVCAEAAAAERGILWREAGGRSR